MEIISGPKAFGRDKEEIKLWSVGVMVLGCFLISRAVLLDNIFPAGIALITILISANTLNFYLLPVMLIGLGSHFNSGYHFWGDMGAICACAFVFVCMGKVKFATWQKAVIAAAISIIANSIYYIAAGLMYRITIADLLIEGAVVAILCGIFSLFLKLMEGQAVQGGMGGNLTAFVAVAMLIVAGTGFSWILIPAAMLLVLLIGYTMGTMEGICTGFIAGMLILFCGGGVGVTVTLCLGGAVAGFSKGQNKIVAALCFAAVCMGLGFIDVSLNLNLPVYYPLSAAAVLIFIPKKWLLRLDAILSKVLRSGAYHEKKKSGKTFRCLSECRKTFDELTALYTSAGNNRTIMAYLFRGLSQIMNNTARDVISDKETQEEIKYEAESAWSGYSRNISVSGDSYMWEDLGDGRFVIVLSDGMGKGEKAAVESNLAVTTIVKLLKAGLEVELVLKILNSILLLKSEEEIFSTVDLGILNKRTGKMKFYKIGAAATFIKRKNSVETVKVSAMPMGIVDGLKIDYVTVNLHPGDQVIMVSDGVTDSRRDDFNTDWLKEVIGEIKSKDPQTMCDLVMNRAVENYGVKEKDDLTVLSLRLH